MVFVDWLAGVCVRYIWTKRMAKCLSTIMQRCIYTATFKEKSCADWREEGRQWCHLCVCQVSVSPARSLTLTFERLLLIVICRRFFPLSPSPTRSFPFTPFIFTHRLPATFHSFSKWCPCLTDADLAPDCSCSSTSGFFIATLTNVFLICQSMSQNTSKGEGESEIGYVTRFTGHF